MAARRFLYVVAALIFLVLALGLAWSLAPFAIMRAALVPHGGWTMPPGAPDYRRPDAWLARPGARDDAARWLPAGLARPPAGPAAVFFIPPTTYLDRSRWNAPYDDRIADARSRLITGAEASAFTGVGRVWAPRYRQATIGAFLTDRPEAARALDLAYQDVARAFDTFLAEAPPDAPILLAGHSQGSFHLLRLLRERIAGTPRARRIVAAYAVGWPVSIKADLPALGLPACTAAAQAGCLLSWESFAEPADPRQLRLRYDASAGFTGAPRRGTAALCVNPLTGTAGGSAPAAANLGALRPEAGLEAARLVPGLVPARCAADGLLLIGAAPAGYGLAVLPGNNYHVFDYALFWANIRADAARRLAAWSLR
ncbi:DUF3089 domain-containing protein [Sphingomonas morindae]|uniref:DUF3089 domain-containing protein n=1 Tax=Sphingomonas morindae TaxID=1541170 RepID=A0ABY4X8F2_9SPHN|nr:DUF3089 domain-containing protein [Sphingomonas morindae]USI73216.1 DUF3089 domain-containing protein [Sphingomonas morindae]